MRVLVTGAAGFIGSHVVERLLRRGDEVLGVDNFDPFYSPLEKRRNVTRALACRGFEFIELDIADRVALAGALATRRIDAIAHFAAKAGVRPSIQDPVSYARANVLGTQALLAEAEAHSIRRIVFASSSSVYGNSSAVPFRETDPAIRPVSPYAATKRAGELLCHTHQLLWGGSMLCLRFFTVYGPRQRPDLAIRKFSELMTAGKSIQLFGDGSSGRDYTWIDDIVNGVMAALDRGERVPNEFEIVNLGGSRVTTLAQLVELLSQSLDVRPAIEHLPAQQGDVERTWADVSKARDLLGYSPSVPIEEGIAEFSEWFRHSLAQTR